MASHHSTIAKTSFAAACLRPDVTKLSREDLSNFHVLLEAAISRCSPANIQKCKEWLLTNIVPSSQRTYALSKYLASFSKHSIIDDNASNLLSSFGVSKNRRRLHALYLIHDLLHSSTYHVPDSSLRNNLTEALQSNLQQIIIDATSEAKTKVTRRINDLIKIWDQEQYFSKTYLDEVRKRMSCREAIPGVSVVTHAKEKGLRELPYTMPATHGDPSAPYYDLPAANLMPHIIPNSPVSMRPESIRALQLSAGPADEGLVNAVKDFLDDVRRLDDPFASLEEDGIVANMDELGQLSYRNEDDEIVGDTYYGWSRAFCDKMKKRDREKNGSEHQRGRSYSTSRSRSPPKRQRYEDSSDVSRSRSRPRRERSISLSSDRDRPRFGQDIRPNRFEQQVGGMQYAVPPFVSAMNIPQPPFPILPLGPNGMPIPPPKPPNWKGPWPPPPPPYNNTGGHSNMPFSTPPPPPPPF